MADTSDHSALDAYFAAHSGSSTSESQASKMHRLRSFSVSEPTIILPGQTLSPLHPALSLSSFVDIFGPLIFPIYRAALARKRILIITHAPVEPACNFVYDISILSNIPLSVVSHLPRDPDRLKPLFSVGVHDIPFLSAESETGAGYVACTTDEILAMKTQLYDVLIRLPPAYSANANRKVWPTLEEPTRSAPPGSPGIPIKATQRDLRRFRILQKSLHQRYRRDSRLFLDDGPVDTPAAAPPSDPDIHASDNDDGDKEDETDASDDDDNEPDNVEEVCEHLTWREIAYSSFIWWASAGENGRSSSTPGSGTTDEEDMDRLVEMTRLSYPNPGHPHHPHPASHSNTSTTARKRDISPSRDDAPPTSTSSSSETEDAATTEVRLRKRPPIRPTVRRDSVATIKPAGPEMDLIAYFHRFTQRIVTTLANAVDAADADNEAVENVAANAYSDDDTDHDTGVMGRGDEGEAERGEDNDAEELLPAEAVDIPPRVFVSIEDLEAMGLDRYSDRDAKMVGEILATWWGREADVQRWRFTCCGVECG